MVEVQPKPSYLVAEADPKPPEHFFDAALDEFFAPERVTNVDEATQKIMSHPAGQLDWIGGFARNAHGKLLIEAYLTPVLRCYIPYRHSWAKIPICESIVRTRSPAILHPVPVKILGRISCGGIYLLRKALADLPGIQDAKIYDDHDPPEFTSYNLVFDIQDERCYAAPYRDIKHKFPQLAKLIETWKSPCPDSVSFFIARDGKTTVVIPTIEILRSCYLPNRTALEDFLTSPDRRTFLSTSRYVGFNGFRYVDGLNEDVVCYPARAERNIERAEREITQLLPRASAYNQRHGTLLPILIGPPFAGRVRLSGSAVSTDSQGGNKLIFFPHGVGFGPINGVRNRGRRPRSVMAFAPDLEKYAVELTDVPARVEWYHADTWTAAHDVRLFRRMTDAVVRGIENHTYSGPVEELFTDNDFGHYREWLLRHNYV